MFLLLFMTFFLGWADFFVNERKDVFKKFDFLLLKFNANVFTDQNSQQKTHSVDEDPSYVEECESVVEKTKNQMENVYGGNKIQNFIRFNDNVN